MMKLPLRLDRVEHKRTEYFLIAPPDTPLATVMASDYWAHVKNLINLYDVFEVMAADGTYDARFRVVSINRATGTLGFRLLNKWAPAQSAEAVTATIVNAVRYKTAWNVARKGYVVQEVATGDVVIEGCVSKIDAETKAIALEAQQAAA